MASSSRNFGESRYWHIHYGPEAFHDDADCIEQVEPKVHTFTTSGLPGVKATTYVLRDRADGDWFQWYNVYTLLALEEYVSVGAVNLYADIYVCDCYTIKPIDVTEFGRLCSMYSRDSQFVTCF
jgi:hypothetical protein